MCPDGTGEFADISCGDPWYRDIPDGEPGRSLILVRTETGRRVLHDAVRRGYLHIEPTPDDCLRRSQPNLLAKRSALWGRLLALRMMGAPVPRYEGFYLFQNWLHSHPREKVRSVFGMVRRAVARGYARPQRILPRGAS